MSEAPGNRLRMGELGSKMVFSSSRVTYQVKSMERRGLVLRQPGEDDKRVNYAVLTATGLETLREAGPSHVGQIQAIFTDDLDEHELRVLTEVFGRLRNRLLDSAEQETADG
ncbi:MarR family winged helix-turn-helix transcriptional regulator [Saccharopolyspora antimicrobica]|uniref:MarR family winged helix-turn-helix transcriptional regulator n=1 Tax=Saccharopolyspora antimicrobica TaxID=455193 RepID=UPI0024826513|nr:MarR family transcriptional regulator [Saccharopolyspora antimicrobica]